MKAFAIATALAVGLCATAISKSRAADGDFVEVTSTERGWVYSVKEGSVRVNKDRAGKAIVQGLFEVSNPAPASQLRYLIVYVTLSDCAAGYGKVVWVSASDPSRAELEDEFAARGQSVNSIIADGLCEAAGEELSGGGRSMQAVAQADVEPRELKTPITKREADARTKALAAWQDKVRAKIHGNIILPQGIPGNPEAIFDISLLPTGEVLSAKQRRSSGHAAYDEAVERAILKSSPLPKPDNPAFFERQFELRFRPLDGRLK